jgi:hypothetical protein
MNIPGQALYEGQWKSDKFEGRGKIFYTSGDFYHGQVNQHFLGFTVVEI